MQLLKRIDPVRTSLMTLAIVSLAPLVRWHRLNTDLDNVMSLLRDVWINAGVNGKQLIVRFDGDIVTVTDGDQNRGMSTMSLPTLHEVNYDTTLGDNMIAYVPVWVQLPTTNGNMLVI